MNRFALIVAGAALVPQMVFAQAPAPASASPTLDFGFYRTRVEPMFLVKRPGNIRGKSLHDHYFRFDVRFLYCFGAIHDYWPT